MELNRSRPLKSAKVRDRCSGIAREVERPSVALGCDVEIDGARAASERIARTHRPRIMSA